MVDKSYKDSDCDETNLNIIKINVDSFSVNIAAVSAIEVGQSQHSVADISNYDKNRGNLSFNYCKVLKSLM